MRQVPYQHCRKSPVLGLLLLPGKKFTAMFISCLRHTCLIIWLCPRSKKTQLHHSRVCLTSFPAWASPCPATPFERTRRASSWWTTARPSSTLSSSSRPCTGRPIRLAPRTPRLSWRRRSWGFPSSVRMDVVQMSLFAHWPCNWLMP